MRDTEEEYERLITRRRIKEGLYHRRPPSADYRFSVGQPVYAYRENLKHFTGSHLLLQIDEKKGLLDFGELTVSRSFNIFQLKPAKLPSISEVDPESRPEIPCIAIHTEIIAADDLCSRLFDDDKRA